MRSGVIYLHIPKVYSAGNIGDYWTAAAHGSDNLTFFLYINDGTVGPTNYTNRADVFPLRCLAN